MANSNTRIINAAQVLNDGEAVDIKISEILGADPADPALIIQQHPDDPGNNILILRDGAGVDVFHVAANGSVLAANVSTDSVGDNGLTGVVWAGVAAPTGSNFERYTWYRNNGVVTFWMIARAAVAGTAITSLEFELPVGTPAPALWTSQPTSTTIAYGSGDISTSALGSAGLAATTRLFVDGAGLFKINVTVAASVAAQYAWATVSYRSS